MSLRAVGVVSVRLHIVLDGAAAAPSAWCRSNRAFKSTFRAAGPPALCCHAIMACCERLRSRCKGRREVGARQRDGLRPFCGSAKLATVAPWQNYTEQRALLRGDGRLTDCAMMKECR